MPWRMRARCAPSGRRRCALSARPGAPFLRFPTNLLLRREGGPAVSTIEVAPPATPAAGTRVLALLRAMCITARDRATASTCATCRRTSAPTSARRRSVPGWRASGRGNSRPGASCSARCPFGQQGNAWLCRGRAARRLRRGAGRRGARDRWRTRAVAVAAPARRFVRQRPAAGDGGDLPPAADAARGHDQPAPAGPARRHHPAVRGAGRHAALDHPARIHILPHGIDADFFTPGPRAEGRASGCSRSAIGCATIRRCSRRSPCCGRPGSTSACG